MTELALTPQDIRNRNLVWIARFYTVLGLVAGLLFAFLGVKTQNWYNYLVTGSFALVAGTAVIILSLRRAKKSTLNAWHLISSLTLTAFLVSAVQSNAGTEIGIAVLIILLTIVLQCLPPEQILRGAILATVASLVSGVLAFYSPLPQTVDTTVDLIITWVARGSTLAFLALIMMQFRRLTLTNKLLISFLGAVVMISLTFNIVTSTTSTISMTDQVGQSLHAVSESRGALAGDYVNKQVEVLQTFALDETIRQSVRAANALKPNLESILELDEQWQQAIAGGSNSSFINSRLSNSLSNDLRAFQELSPDHIEVFITDLAGAIVSATNPTSDYYQADEDWWVSAYNTGSGDVYISQPVFDESAGALSILIAVPIYDTREGGLIGILRSTISIDRLVFVLRDPIGETGEVDILFPDETVLDTRKGAYEAIDPDSIAAIRDSAKATFLKTPYKGEVRILAQSGVLVQSSTAKINDLDWSVIVSQDTYEALAPVREQARLTSFFSTIVASIAALLSLVVSQRLAQPITNLTETANKIAKGNLNARASIESQDEIGLLAGTFNTMTTQLQEILLGLEERVAERTAELEESSNRLEKRASQFEAIAQLARTITTIQDIESLLPRITQLVSQHFGFYHAGLFLLDESCQYAVLTAANSEGGQRMLARKHRLGVGQTGIVGYVTSTGNPRIALDTGADAVYFDNPDMPDTRSEMALPLRVGKTIIGALDVQSTEPNAFSEDDVEVLSILADEISIAIENARLFVESQRVLADAQSAFGEFTHEAWQKMVRGRKVVGYELAGTTIHSLEEPIKNNGSSISVPIKLRERVIGSMNINLPENKELTPDDVDITQALAQRISIAIETVTLLEETRRRATRESMIGDISAKLSATAEVERLMQVAVGELRQALGASEVTLKIGSDE